MGNSKYLDSLNTDEKTALSRKLWNIQNHRCFICEEEIDPDIQKTNIDHIRPLATGGKDDPSNYAITHEHCNKSKQDADLEVAKKLYQLTKIISQAEIAKETPSLKHVLVSNGGSKFVFKYKIEEKQLVYAELPQTPSKAEWEWVFDTNQRYSEKNNTIFKVMAVCF